MLRTLNQLLQTAAYRKKKFHVYINLFFTHTLMCVSTVYSVLTRVLWKKKSQACYSGGIRTHSHWNDRAVSYQLDYRGCSAARVSSNPMFWQRVPQRCKRCSICMYIAINANICSGLTFRRHQSLSRIGFMTAQRDTSTGNTWTERERVGRGRESDSKPQQSKR